MKTGISPATLSSIFNGRTEPSLKVADLLHKVYPQLNMSWLMFGEGEMFVQEETRQQLGAVPSSGDGEVDLFSSHLAPDNDAAESQNLQFDIVSGDKPQAVVREVVKYIDKPQRRITEIRIFFDDGTFETFPGR